MRTFRQVALVLGSVLLSGGLAFGQAKLGLYVVDSNGAMVGYAMVLRGVTIFIDGEAVGIDSGKDGFVPNDFQVSFAAADCGGTGYLRQGYSGGVRVTYTWGYYTTDRVLHYCLSDAVQEVAVQSSRLVHSDGSLDPCVNGADGFLGAPVLTAAAPTLTPPFRVVEALQVSPAPPSATFNDVPTNHPLFQFIEALYASGITAGCQAAPRLYCPDNPVTRGQLAVFIAKALGL